jgi:hypothetical protein
MRPLALLAGMVCASAVLLAASGQRAAPGQRATPRGRAAAAATTAKCAAELGQGVTTGRRFCDVIVATKAVDSIAITIPPHRGTAKLLFDLHNRVAARSEAGQPPQVFARNSATVAVIGPKTEISRAAAVSEFRTLADLFDRIAGGGAGGVKAVGPGPASPIDVTVPAGITAVGIVGVRLEVVTRLGRQSYDTPGRPIAIVSNIRAEYTPLR